MQKTPEEIFKEKLGNPVSEEHLIKYLKFVKESVTTVKDSQKHHLFPKSVFPELKKNKEFLFRLSFLDHITAHELLAEAYPIQQFITPLNWLVDPQNIKQIKHFAEMSNFQIKRWSNLKNTSKYTEYLQKRKESWEKFKNSEAFADYCEKRKLWWVEFRQSGRYEEYVEKQRKDSTERYQNSDYQTKASVASKSKWEKFKKSPQYSKWLSETVKRFQSSEFQEKMYASIDDRWNGEDGESNRQAASLHFKKLWEDEQYKNRVKKNMREMGKRPEIKKQRSDRMSKRWSDPEKAKSMTEKITLANKNVEKRLDAGTKLKKLWATKEFRDKMKNRYPGSRDSGKWWNDGTVEIKRKICPENFSRGRLKRTSKRKKT